MLDLLNYIIDIPAMIRACVSCLLKRVIPWKVAKKFHKKVINKALSELHINNQSRKSFSVDNLQTLMDMGICPKEFQKKLQEYLQCIIAHNTGNPYIMLEGNRCQELKHGHIISLGKELLLIFQVNMQ